MGPAVRALTFTLAALCVLGCGQRVKLGTQATPQGAWSTLASSLWRGYPRTSLAANELDGYASSPSLAPSGTNLWVAWSEVDARTDCAPCNILGYLARYTSGSWQLMPTFGGQKSPLHTGMPLALAVDAEDTPWVAVKFPNDSGWDTRLLRFDASSSAWSDLGAASDAPRATTDGAAPVIGILKGSPVLAWAQPESSGTSLHARRYASGGFTDLDSSGLSADTLAHCPDLAVATDGSVALAWLEGNDTLVAARWTSADPHWHELGRDQPLGTNNVPAGALGCPSLTLAPDGSPRAAIKVSSGNDNRFRVVTFGAAGPVATELPVPATSTLLSVSQPRVASLADGDVALLYVSAESTQDAGVVNDVPQLQRFDGSSWSAWGDTMPSVLVPSDAPVLRPALGLGTEDVPTAAFNQRPSDFYSIAVMQLPARLP